jgi:hypothetical protein
MPCRINFEAIIYTKNLGYFGGIKADQYFFSETFKIDLQATRY